MQDRYLRTGIFLAPFHALGENPTLAIERDMELVEHLDRLNYHEAWIGEHHSGGFEIIACPEMFLAAAAVRTRNIRLGTGVVSLPYHHPFTLASGKHGIGMLSIGGTSDEALLAHANNWSIHEEAAAKAGMTPDRSKWRIVTFAHVAETRERARAEVAYGLADFCRYFTDVATF